MKLYLKKSITLIFLLFSIYFFGQKYGQFSGSLESNSQWYIDDKKTGGFNNRNPFRSNNYLNIYHSIGKFSSKIQIESYAPQALLNFSPNLNKSIGIATFSIKYQTNKLDLTLGNFYDQFGSGLIFRSWEDRPLGFNNSIRGFRLRYRPKNISLNSFIGKQRDGFKLSKSIVYGFNSDINIFSNLTIGLSYIGRKQKQPPLINSKINETTKLYSSRIKYSGINFYSSIEYVYKDKDLLVEFESLIDNRLFSGSALLFNIGYTKSGFGLDVTFRRVENMSTYADREVYGNIYNNQFTNYIPSLTRQHNFSLANIYVYQAQPQLTFIPFGKAGEIGTQLNIFYNFKKGSSLGGKFGTFMSLNYSQWNRLNSVYDLSNRSYNSKFLSFGNKNFNDLNVEINKKWSSNFKSKFAFINIYYDKEYLEEKVGKINATIFATELKYFSNKRNETHLQLQHLWTKNDKKNWMSASIEHHFSNIFSLYINDMYNYGNSREIERIHYYNIGSSYSYNKLKISVGYGRQRGGLVCIGGICRFIPNSTGLSIDMNLNF